MDLPDTIYETILWNALETGHYETPHLRGGRSHCWLILRRFGGEGQYLELSDAGPAPAIRPETAPKTLVPVHSLLALLTSDDPAQARFIFSRALPDQVTPSGIFFPADGHVTLRGRYPALRLTAVGRHFHRDDCDPGALCDLPEPPLGAKGGLSWTFDATALS